MADIVAINRTVVADSFNMQPVEIIIPFYNQSTKVVNLIQDIFLTVQRNRYLITLVDDGSKNPDFIKQLEEKKIPGLRFIIHEKNSGFGAAVNNALRYPFSDNINWVCILHSDVRISDANWLYNLGTSMNKLKSKGVKMIAPLTNNPVVDNPLLKADKATYKDDIILTEGFLPFYCVFAHRQLFNTVGLLPEYPYAGVEVEVYAKAMKEKGFFQAVCNSSWVQHEGRGTLKHLDNNKKVQEILRKVKESKLEKPENKAQE